VFLTGLTFAAMGLVITALAPSYDFFMFYFTLLITPMTLLSGVFFPVSQLPAFLRAATDYLPLTHSVALVRPLLLGQPVTDPATHIAVLAGVGAVAYWAAAVLVRRRLLA
jgi:lipooligosaccharide transport system permease protein